MEYTSLRGTRDGMDLSVITEIADYFERKMGISIPERTPFVGKNFNVTRAGIHADGLLKDQEIYNIFDTEKILNRPARVIVDSFSGLAGIAFWINSYFRLKEDEKIDKKSPLVQKIKDKVDAVYAQGRTTSMGDKELCKFIKDIDPKAYEKLSKNLPKAREI